MSITVSRYELIKFCLFKAIYFNLLSTIVTNAKLLIHQHQQDIFSSFPLYHSIGETTTQQRVIVDILLT